MAESYDCRSCGACCVNAGDVTVSPADRVPRWLTRSVRLRPGYDEWDADAGLRRMARTPDNRCAALRGEVGKGCTCSIHVDRPDVCREFDAGSPGCLRSRRLMGFPTWTDTAVDDQTEA